jgi:poly(3-hydroxybutyrate) depolymerase
MYQLAIDWQRAQVRPWLEGGREIARGLPAGDALRATFEHWLTNLEAGRPQDLRISARIEAETGRRITDETLLDEPFVRVSRLRAAGTGARRQLLLVAPYSGYATHVAGPLIAALLEHTDVVVTEWRDARLVPLTAGGFGFDRQVEVVTRVLRQIGPEVDVVSISQGTLPALVALALLAEDGAPAARSLALLAGPLDPTRNPPPGTLLPPMVPFDWIELLAFQPVGSEDPGAGRLVFPGLAQLLLIAASHPGDYLQAQVGSWIETYEGRVNGWSRSLADLHAVSDIPAELARDMMQLVFRDLALVRGTLELAGRRVQPERLEGLALLTVEAGNDALVGPGQTHAAHGLCPRIANANRAWVTLKDAEHYDLFTGPKIKREVVPTLEAFFARITP